MTVVREVDTSVGPGRLHLDEAASPTATLLVSHGAGNGIETRDLEALAAALPPQGISVARFEQPWRVAGRKIATAPPTLDVGLRAAAALIDAPLVVGGRSAGARSAVRCASSVGAIGALALAFPLHPPGRPERSRLDELLGAGVPTLVVQGERDAFGAPEEFPDDVDLAVVPSADHSFQVLKRAPLSQDDALAVLVEATLEWLMRAVG